MRERLRVLLATCFYYSGLVKLAHWYIQRSHRRLIILNYHSATEDNLRHQLRYLNQQYRIMHLEDALEEFSMPYQNVRDKRIPMVLTFDDGYLDNYTHGLQLARELQIPITIFLIPGYIESGTCFWWLAGETLLARTKVEKVMIEGKAYTLPTDRQELARTIDEHLRYATSVEVRETFLAQLQEILEVSLPNRAQDGGENTSLPLNWDEIYEMAKSGFVSFGAHTMHHPVLGYLTDTEEVAYEVKEARRVLEQQLGHPIRTFAYPIGKMEHIGDAGVQAVLSAGYTWALTTIEETNTPDVDPHLLCRLPGDISQHWLVMASELVGLLGIVSRLRGKKK
ncbi:MAG: polysaccharide deacetylase family protein [Ktedonobacteraceae bacterium]